MFRRIETADDCIRLERRLKTAAIFDGTIEPPGEKSKDDVDEFTCGVDGEQVPSHAVIVVVETAAGDLVAVPIPEETALVRT